MTLYFQDEGSGEPLVLLHGLFGSSANLRTLARQLAERFRVLSVDLPNHGRSAHTKSMTYPDMSEALYNLSKRLATPRLNWVGHSMGGKAIMHLALTHSDCVNRLVVMDIAPVNYDHRHGEFFDAMCDLDLDRIGSRAEAERELSLTVTNSAIRKFLLQNLKRDGGRFTWRINLPVLSEFHDDLLAFPDVAGSTFSGPTLVLSGARSSYVSSAHYRTFLRYFPNAVFSVVQDAGHWLHIDQPERVASAVVKFLQQGRVFDKEY